MRRHNSRKDSLPVRPSEQFMCLLDGGFLAGPFWNPSAPFVIDWPPGFWNLEMVTLRLA